VSEQLLLINPRRRKKSHRRRAKNHRRRSRRAAGGFRIRRRRHKNPRNHRRSRRRNPIMRRRHRRHRNPISMSGIKGVLVPAAIGAAGGLALNVLWNYASPYVPTTFTSSPYLIAAVNIAIALGLGMLARKVMNANTANALVAGAITIQIYSAASFALSGTIPGLSGLGAYLPGSGMNGLGSPNPAPYLNGIGRLRRTGRVGPGTLSAYMGPGMQGLGALGGGTLGGLAMMPGGMSTDMD
jgi:hypothetical protein